MIWFTLLLLSFVTARITRYIVLDTMIEKPREKLRNWLIDDPDVKRSVPSRYLRSKLSELITCPYCVSVWIGGFLNLGVWLVARYTSVDVEMPLPALWWLALSMIALVWLEWTDGERRLKVSLHQGHDHD